MDPPQPHVTATVSPLPQILVLACLKKEDVPKHMHALIKLLFFSKSPNPFISYTETHEEISFIIDEESFQMLSTGILTTSSLRWRALQFSLGSSPFEVEGFVESMAKPLGRMGISIFFFTTFNNDYILVEECKYKEAEECVKSMDFIVWAEEDGTTESQGTKELREGMENLSIEGPRNIKEETFKHLSVFPQLSLCLTCINADTLHTAVKDLIKLIFYPESTFRFISFTQMEDEVSLIIDAKSLETFPKENLEVVLDKPTWVPFKRTQKLGFTETGVVSALATPLKKLNMLYLSSFNTGWFMVPESSSEEAVERLKEHSFEVTTCRSGQ